MREYDDPQGKLALVAERPLSAGRTDVCPAPSHTDQVRGPRTLPKRPQLGRKQPKRRSAQP